MEVEAAGVRGREGGREDAADVVICGRRSHQIPPAGRRHTFPPTRKYFTGSSEIFTSLKKKEEKKNQEHPKQLPGLMCGGITSKWVRKIELEQKRVREQNAVKYLNPKIKTAHFGGRGVHSVDVFQQHRGKIKKRDV